MARNQQARSATALLPLTLLLTTALTQVSAQTPRTSGPPMDYWEPVVRSGQAYVRTNASAGEKEGRSLEGFKNLVEITTTSSPHPCNPGHIVGNVCTGPDGAYCCDPGFTCCPDNPDLCCPYVAPKPAAPPGFPGCPDASPKQCYTLDTKAVFCCQQGEACGGDICIAPPIEENCPSELPTQCILSTGRGAYCCGPDEICCGNKCCSTRDARSACPYAKPIICQNFELGSQFCCSPGQKCCGNECCSYDTASTVTGQDPGTPADPNGAYAQAPDGSPRLFYINGADVLAQGPTAETSP